MAICFTFRVIIKWRFSDRVEKQMHAFMDGFNDIIPQQLLSVFDPNELEVNCLPIDVSVYGVMGFIYLCIRLVMRRARV